MKSRHVLGTVFCLAASVLYTPLAFANATVRTREVIQHIPGTLLEQMDGMEIGSVESGAAGNDFTIIRSDGSEYVVENVVRDASGAVSAMVSAYDSNGTLTETVALNNGVVVDANRIDFEAEITLANGSAAATTVVGSLTGLRTTMYTAVGSINADGESRAAMVDYSGVNDSGDMTAPSVVLTPMDGDGVGSVLREGGRHYFGEGVLLFILMIFAIIAMLCAACYIPGCCVPSS